ncbi:MAG TPA: amino acid permease [Candidatus Sulfotelmatobacter sp.]|jgi:APA family basic amino acid/polyamine antiporter
MSLAHKDAEPQLYRGLTLAHTVSLIVGTVIGTGVFLKAAVMAQSVGSPGLVLWAWVLAGLLSMAGALTYAELGGLLPHAGGEYVYLLEAYGEGPAFLFGWMRLVMGSAGSIASLAVGFATFLAAILPINYVWSEYNYHAFGQTLVWRFGTQQVLAVGVIILLSALNCGRVVLGGQVQLWVTILKVAGIAVIVGGILLFSKGGTVAHLASPAGGGTGVGFWHGVAPFGTAMLAALWAYEGWNQMPMVAGEVQNPRRNVPRGLIIGTAIIVVVYCLANFSYFYALPFSEVLSSNSSSYRDALPVAAKAAQTFLARYGATLVSIVFVLSTLGALNGTILSSARVPYAMARDRLFFAPFGRLNPATQVPVFSIVVQGVWASLLAISGTYDQLTDCVVFASWIFYALVTTAVFALRRKMPHAERPYKTMAYPFLPLVFVLVAAWLVWNTIHTRPLESTVGLGLIAAGLPLYFYFRKSRMGSGSNSGPV